MTWVDGLIIGLSIGYVFSAWREYRTYLKYLDAKFGREGNYGNNKGL